MVERPDDTKAWLVRALAPVPWIIVVVGGLLIVTLPGGSGSATARTGVSIMIGIFFAVLIFRLVLLALGARRRERWSYLVLAGAFAMWAAGSAAISENQTHGAVSFPAPGEIPQRLVVPAASRPSCSCDVRRAARSLPVLLDATVVLGGTISVTAFALVAPVAQHFDEAWLPLLVAVLFPLVNLVLAGIVLGQISVRRQRPDPSVLDARRRLPGARDR